MPSLVGLQSSPDTDTPGLREGRACRHCAQVKERCILHEDRERAIPICKRCHRLGKKCTTPAPVARKRQRIAISAPNPPTPAPTPSAAAYQHPKLPTIPPEDGQQVVSNTLQGLETSFKQEILDNFRNDMALHFPFLSHGLLYRRDDPEGPLMDVATCEKKVPFSLAAALMAALHRHCVLQRRVSQEILASLANTMILQGRKSLDLLYSILIIEAWYPFHVTKNPQMMNILHLARALIVDLGLSLGTDGLPLRLWADVSKLLFGATGPQDPAAECRAIMGVYYLGALFAVTHRRSDYPHWHESLDRGCRYLEETSKSPLDIQALYSMRLLHLAERYLIPGGLRPNETMTVRAYVSCFRSDLQKFRTTLPASLTTNRFFQLDIQCIELALYDRVVAASPTKHHAETVEALHAFLALVSSYIDNFIAIPIADSPLISTVAKGQISQALEILAKLSTLTGVPGWDCTYVRTHVSFPHAIDRLIDRFEEIYTAERERFPDMEASQFAVYPIKLRQRKKRFEELIAKEFQDSLSSQQTATSAAAAAATSTTGLVGPAGAGSGAATQQQQGTGLELWGVAPGLEAFDEFLEWSYPMEDFAWP